MLEPRELAGELRHRAAALDHREDRLRLLDGELAHHVLPPPRRRLPVDVTRVVADGVVAKAGERATVAALPEHAHARGVQTMLHREQAESPARSTPTA